MPLTMTQKRYEEIRAGVERRRLAEKVKEVRAEPGAMTFASVDEFFDFLDRVEAATERPPGQSREP